MGALVRDVLSNDFRTSVDALADSGFVMHLEQSGGDQGKVIKTAASNLKVYGVAATSTKDNVTGTAQANTEVAIIRDGEVEVQLSATNAAIEEGELLQAIAGGFVDLYVDDAVFADLPAVEAWRQDMGQIVGIATEAKAINVGGKIKCKLQIHALETLES